MQIIFLNQVRQNPGLRLKIRACWPVVILLLLAAGCSKSADKAVDIQVIDGVKHIMNPAEPILGTVALELEKIREINPYEREDVGMKFFFAARSPQGEVILFDPNNIEAHRYGPDNTYLGNMVKKGQGPGEFQQYRGLDFHFIGDEIWASSSQKVAVYDRNGAYLEEYKIGSNRGSPDSFIDRSRFLCEKSEWTDNSQTRRICLESFVGEGPKHESLELYAVTRTDWLIRKERSAFSDSWSCPELLFTYNQEERTILYALNETYKIYVKDTEGNLLYVIEKPHQLVRVGPAEKKILAAWALDRESSKWILDAYPDTLEALISLKVLPNGWLAAFRISGPKEITFDIFDSAGRYLYALELPRDDQLKQLLVGDEQIGFFESGIFTQDTRDDLPVYVEYRVTNLPDIFN